MPVTGDGAPGASRRSPAAEADRRTGSPGATGVAGCEPYRGGSDSAVACGAPTRTVAVGRRWLCPPGGGLPVPGGRGAATRSVAARRAGAAEVGPRPDGRGNMVVGCSLGGRRGMTSVGRLATGSTPVGPYPGRSGGPGTRGATVPAVGRRAAVAGGVPHLCYPTGRGVRAVCRASSAARPAIMPTIHRSTARVGDPAARGAA